MVCCQSHMDLGECTLRPHEKLCLAGRVGWPRRRGDIFFEIGIHSLLSVYWSNNHRKYKLPGCHRPLHVVKAVSRLHSPEWGRRNQPALSRPGNTLWGPVTKQGEASPPSTSPPAQRARECYTYASGD